jgi:hypothetical protein
MSTERVVAALRVMAVTPCACGGCLLTPKVELRPILDTGIGVNPNAVYTHPIEIS